MSGSIFSETNNSIIAILYISSSPSRSLKSPPPPRRRSCESRSFPPGRDVLHLPALRDVDDGRIELLLDAVLALHVVAADLAVLQRLVKGVHRRDGGDALETEVLARHNHDEQTEQKPEDDPDENVPPMVPIVAHSRQRARNGPRAHQTLQPRFQKQRPVQQTVLQVPLCAMQQKANTFVQNKNKKTKKKQNSRVTRICTMSPTFRTVFIWKKKNARGNRSVIYFHQSSLALFCFCFFFLILKRVTLISENLFRGSLVFVYAVARVP